MNGQTLKIAACMLFAPTLFAATPARVHAQEAEVRQAIENTLDAWRAGDFETFANFYHPDTRGFLFDGSGLLTGFNVALLSVAAQAGFGADLVITEYDVKMYGETAVGVGFLEGTISLPTGAVLEGTWRYSETRVNDGGWKIVQYHFSKLDEGLGRAPAG